MQVVRKEEDAVRPQPAKNYPEPKDVSITQLCCFL